MNLRVVFMGSPEFAVPILAALHSTFQVVGVVTQQDKPKGRGQRVVSTPVKAAASELGIPVLGPDRLSSATLEAIELWNPDVIVVAAYGKILPETLLKTPSMGCVNLHASLLPRHRGASPISSAILAGDTMTGICTMLMDRGLDTGDVLMCREIPIDMDDTAGSLHDKFLEPGAALVVETLRLMASGAIKPVPQDDSRATYTGLVGKKDGKIDWFKEADYLARLVRAMNPWPGAFFKLDEEVIKVWQARPEAGSAEPGRLVDIRSDGMLVGTFSGLLLIETVQAAGKKSIFAADFARGKRLKPGGLFN
ncbi:MAG: methionyl-tRNA formyltransferase [Desulfomonile tiedjei]|uniref:Methionyl-tRNA formyltransferase n=1 Tax=Desulfomonile tiedjei TaxID=2358 RepID=A0A9D6Z1Q6_9BACT|nr:methionyl-tRNA formyltransferase [Desulfomonile tiedjei]